MNFFFCFLLSEIAASCSRYLSFLSENTFPAVMLFCLLAEAAGELGSLRQRRSLLQDNDRPAGLWEPAGLLLKLSSSRSYLLEELR